MFVTKLVFLEVLGFVKGVLRGKMFFLFFFFSLLGVEVVLWGGGFTRTITG